MRTLLHDVWGCARGPLRRLAPQTRLLCGAFAFAAVLVVPLGSPAGSLCALAIVLLFGAVGRPPGWLVRGGLALGLAMFLPYLLLVPVIRAEGAVPSWMGALAAPWAVFVRGVMGLLVSLFTVSTLSAGELRAALARLPVPAIVSAILVQIVHQVDVLFAETRSIATAVAVRGGASRGLLRALPRVWLPRVLQRAERVAAAMEVRGFGGDDWRLWGAASTGGRDVMALALAVLGLAAAVAWRLWEGGR